ncbi:MAG: hypothetical protein OEQ39_01470 [Gammaproteobacteria bacterium]|nr:hypothetical protein [Gammaproteobacteria bacterium]MDH3468901.1 hypothetical protein [Gammaproteobacteria bacterium]
MSESGSRNIPFAGTNVVVNYDGPAAKSVVDFLYHDMPAPRSDDDEVVLAVASPEAEQFTMSRNGKELYSGQSSGMLANLLVGETIYNLADRSRGGLVFHAGAVSWDGAGVLLPGKTGAGKTTLTAWLVARGLNYLTDELIYIKTGANRFDAFTRPLNVKAAALPLLQDEFAIDPAEHGSLVCQQATLVPHRALNAQQHREQPLLRLVVFPEYVRDGYFRVERLSAAQTGLRLMGCLVNARNLDGHGFDEVARLSRSITAYSLQYSCFAQIETDLLEILNSELGVNE